jgi:hypothetical protein
MLVYYEVLDDVRDAIQREKTMKRWPRAWKVRLIHGLNQNGKISTKRCFEVAASQVVMAALVAAIHALLTAHQ